MIFRLRHVIQQELQDQCAAKSPSLDLELRETHGQVYIPNIADPDKPGIPHSLGKAVSSGGIRRGAVMLRAVLPQIFPTDRLIAGFPLPAAEKAALIAEKLQLFPLRLRQGTQLVKRPVQAEIRHHIAKILPGRLLSKRLKIRQNLGGGGDKV